MKKILALMLTAVLVLGILTACSKTPVNNDTPANNDTPVNDDTSGSSIDISGLKLIADGVLTVGMEVGYPPMEYFAEDGTTAVGFDVDLIYAVADKLGLEVNIINTAWDGIFEGIGTNYDVVCSAVTINAKRLETMDFSNPYISNYQSIAVKADSTLTFNALTDLSGYSVSMQKETASDNLLDDLISTGSVTNCTPVTNEQVTTCFEQLKNGEVDVVLCDSSVANGYVSKNPNEYKIAYTDTAEPEEFGIAVKKGDSAMQDALNKALAELTADGFFTQNETKWFA